MKFGGRDQTAADVFEERPRVFLLERMRKRKMAEGRVNGSELQVKTKAMPKRKVVPEVVAVDDVRTMQSRKCHPEARSRKRGSQRPRVVPKNPTSQPEAGASEYPKGRMCPLRRKQKPRCFCTIGKAANDQYLRVKQKS